MSENNNVSVVAYETEQEYAPVHVHVLNFPPTEVATPHSVSTSTYTDIGQIVQPLEFDPLRVRAQLLFNGTGTVVLCHSQNQAQAVLTGGASSATQGAAIVCPGTGPSVTLSVENVAALWAVLSGASPSLSVINERRSS